MVENNIFNEDNVEVNEFPQPINTLKNLKDNYVFVKMRNGELVRGKLVAMDLNINISVMTKDGLRFLQGGNIITITDEPKEV